MNTSASHIVDLKKVPNIKWLMCKSLFKKTNKKRPVVLPQTVFCVTNIYAQSEKVCLFHHVVNWQGEKLHPCYIHALAFPVHLKLLLEPEFPFPLLGLLHIENQIRQYRPISVDENLTLTCRLAGLEPHHKGWLFSIITECTSNHELVWSSVSVNLFRTKHSSEVQTKGPKKTHVFTDDTIAVDWHLAANLGRLYAKSSGDYNPIHLAKWSAKLFGFKQHIIHGMWTKSRCLSELQKQLPAGFNNEFSVHVGFKLPLFLPSKVTMSSRSIMTQANDTTPMFKIKTQVNFKVETQVNEQKPSPHLLGSIDYT